MIILTSYLRGILSDMFIYSSMLILGIIGLPFSLVSKNWAYFFIKLYCRTCFLILHVVSNIRVECRGTIPNGSVIVCSKHMSFLDILMLAYYLPRFSFVMKKELIFTPIIGIYGLRVGCVPVARGTGTKALHGMIKEYTKFSHEADEKQIVIYPQGTRVRPREIKEYKIGAGVLYQKFGLPCYLVGTNTGIFWPKGSLKRKPGVAVIEFTEVLEPGLELKYFMEKIEKSIENSSNSLMDEVDTTIRE